MSGELDFQLLRDIDHSTVYLSGRLRIAYSSRRSRYGTEGLSYSRSISLFDKLGAQLRPPPETPAASDSALVEDYA